MKTPHFRMRVVDVLRLQPMDAEQVARCLSCSGNAVREAMHALCAMGVVRQRTEPRAKGPQRRVFEIAA